MPKYKVKGEQALLFDGLIHAIGEEVELSAERAKDMADYLEPIKAGAPAKKPVAKKAAPKG